MRIATLNVFTDNTDYPKIIDYLRNSKLDVVFFSEIEPPLIKSLQDLSDLYPYVYDESLEGTHGLGFISKYPLSQDTVMLDERNHRFLKAGLNLAGARNCHLCRSSPSSPSRTLVQKVAMMN